MIRLRISAWVVCLTVLSTSVRSAELAALENGEISAVFGPAGLTRVTSMKAKQSVDISADGWSVTVSGETLSPANLTLVGRQRTSESVTYRYEAGEKAVDVSYELKPGWRFVSKQLALTLAPASTGQVERIEVLAAQVQSPIVHEQRASSASGAVFLRVGAREHEGRLGAFLALQNPFLQWERKDGQVRMAYAPGMEWRSTFGPFLADRVCVGVYPLMGVELPARNLAEWKYVPDPGRAFEGKPRLDRADFEAMTQCVSAFALFRPTESLRVHVPWCENDYQVDVATETGRAEWKRILDQCAAVGVQHSLFTPANSAVAPLQDNADAWGWENCLWLGLGQKIRKGEWNIASDPIPGSIEEMLNYARSRNVKLVAYVYPTLGWKQDAEWTAWCGGKTGGYVGVDTGVRSFQDWFVDQLVAFQKRTGIGGYSFDHWWIAYEPTKEGHHPTSKYAQWFGCRRILEELRRRSPDVVIDGRQQYQWFGPWTWLGGSYPHPSTNDEQPGSFENFPDLHFSRVSGDRQRWATWFYHMEQFTPWELVPGYMTHQTPRNDASGQCVKDRPFQTRDWDYLGWRYSVLSSIGTAPFNHVVNLLPARDEAEFSHFRPEDQRWLREWMDWTDQNRATLRNLRPILGPPALGRVDGAAAFQADRGFVFLFNPNYRELTAEFALNGDLGLSAGGEFLLRELYPQRGRWVGQPGKGVWRFGDTVAVPIKGPEACVLEVLPASAVSRPLLLNARGRVSLNSGRLDLADVEGEVGTKLEAGVLLPDAAAIGEVRVNGRIAASSKQGERYISVPVSFAGARFRHCEQIGTYDPAFSNTVAQADLEVPSRVFKQLAQRRAAWPIPYTPEELLATWRGSDRLLLFVQIADPDDRWEVSLKLDGQPVEVKKAYSDVFPLGRERTFTGFYADMSRLAPDVKHVLEVTLPGGLQPGQFQGLFLENVETEYTRELAP